VEGLVWAEEPALGPGAVGEDDVLEHAAAPCPLAAVAVQGLDEGVEKCPCLAIWRKVLFREIFRSSSAMRCRGRGPIATTGEVPIVTPVVFTALMLLPFAAEVAPLVLHETCRCIQPGWGRHRLVTRGRHAKRGPQR